MLNSRITSKRTSPVPRPKIEKAEPTHTLPSTAYANNKPVAISIQKGRELKNLYNLYNERVEST